MPTAKQAQTQGHEISPAETGPADSTPAATEPAGDSDQPKEPPPARRTREQTAAGSRRLRSGATLAEPGAEDQLMSLDASGKPVVIAKATSPKGNATGSSKPKHSSSTSHSVPSQRQKASASGNKSTAASQRTTAQQQKGPATASSGQSQADSPSPSNPGRSPEAAVTAPTEAATSSEATHAPSTAQTDGNTGSKQDLSPVLRSTKGPAPLKVGSGGSAPPPKVGSPTGGAPPKFRSPSSPRSPRQPASPSDRKTRAGAESRRVQEETAAAAEKLRQEDAVIEHAQDIHDRRTMKQLPAFPEPKRGKAHWDHVLEEMNWMAKEFSKERRWKIAQAKRFARLVSKSNLDVEGRERLRRKEEMLKLKRRAAWIAKEAMQFWRKVERVVQFKQQVVSNARKKEVMDKHLDFLVGQTQRYSTLLAQRLAGAEDPAALPGGDAAQPMLTGSPAIPALPAAAAEAHGQIDAEDVSEAEGLPSVRSAAVISAARAATTASLPKFKAELSEDEEEEAGRSEQDDASSAEYNVGMQESEDDEATLEEEEALSRAEGGTKNELNSLEAEADMPLEQLLAQYGYVLGNAQETNSDDAGPSTNEVDNVASDPVELIDPPRKRQKTSASKAHSSKAAETVPSDQPKTSAQDSAAQDSMSLHSAPQDSAMPEADSESEQSSADLRDLLERPEAALAAETAAANQLSPALPGGLHRAALPGAGSSTPEPGRALAEEALYDSDSGRSESDFDSAAGSDPGVDDEQTLEEEECMANAEGSDQHAAELADLEDEANMPLEQLMAKYGYTANAGAAASPHPSPSPSKPPQQPPQSQYASSTATEAAPTAVLAPTAAAANPLAATVQSVESPSDATKAATAQKHAEAKTDSQRDGQLTAPAAAAEQLAQQAQQATAAGMDVFEHSQALAERRASGSQAGPSHPTPPAAGARARARNLTSKAQVAGEVAAAAHTAASLPIPTQSAPQQLPTTTPTPVTQPPSPEQAPAQSAALQDPRDVPSKGSMEGINGQAVSLSRLTKRQQEADQKAAEGKAQLEGVAKLANELQPTGSTLSTTQVHTKVPFLLKNTLREYQHIGLDWLMTIYTRRLNGILADEMGLGKTIMTIALLAHLACEKGDWGPHLIVVPTSVMLNWEMEFKKWCPAFKLLTYFGSAKERKIKRHGWSKPNAFHICITSYTLVLQDAKMFRRKKWKYLILDEAHMIKNWKSQRWQTLLNFNSKRRLLITGTPLQNDLMELWSLMHFLMPQIFASHAQFKDWFNNPLLGMVEGQQQVNKGIVERLHSVLRPFLLRRLKCDVEKQLPQKVEHVIRCRLSKRQRGLYEDYMASSDTSATLASSNFLGIINVLMQLRKVCNHPDLFEGRPIVSSFDMWGLSFQLPSLAANALRPVPRDTIRLDSINADVLAQESQPAWAAQQRQALAASRQLIDSQLGHVSEYYQEADDSLNEYLGFPPSRQALAIVQTFAEAQATKQQQWARSRLQHAADLTARRCAAAPLYGQDLRQAVHVDDPVADVHLVAARRNTHLDFADSIAAAVRTAAQRAEELEDTMKQFLFAIPQARAPPPLSWCSHPDQSLVLEAARQAQRAQQAWFQSSDSLRTAIVRRQLFFPDRRLLQFDCGKLQELAKLLHQLKSGGHKALIFTQMTKMLDVLEAFLNLHAYTYLRLDGTTKPEQRQILMQRFNTNPKIFVFILSTRSGGVGMNLTGADTVIFYDSDWNPAMDAQAQDRCHRIGQTREVHIYRLVSEKTIEENILTKSDQKRQLDHLAIQSGGFNTEFLQKFNPRELLGVQSAGNTAAPTAGAAGTAGTAGSALSAEEMQAAMRSVEDETDAAAAAALEQENAAELAEFTQEPAARAAGEGAPGDAGDEAEEEDAEGDDMRDPTDARAREPSMPISTSSGPDPKKPLGGPSQAPPSSALVPLAGADEDEMMQDVAAMAGGGQVSGQDALSNLETTLRPVEKYAVRFLEEMQRQTEAENAAAEAEELQVQQQEWNMAELERMQEQQEADMDEEGDAERAAQWDLAAADAAYKAQVEAALAQQTAAEEEQRLLIEQLEAQAAAAAAARAQEEEQRAAKAQRRAVVRAVRSRAATPSSDSEEQPDSPYTRYRGSRWLGKRHLDEDRPLGRGMRLKQEPAHIQNSSFASGSDPLSPPASKRRRSQFTSTGPSRPTRPLHAPRQPPQEPEGGVSQGRNAAAAATRPTRRIPRHVFTHAPAALTARGAPVQIWQPWEAAEDLVLCAIVRSAIANALGLPPDAVPGSAHPNALRPASVPGPVHSTALLPAPGTVQATALRPAPRLVHSTGLAPGSASGTTAASAPIQSTGRSAMPSAQLAPTGLPAATPASAVPPVSTAATAAQRPASSGAAGGTANAPASVSPLTALVGQPPAASATHSQTAPQATGAASPTVLATAVPGLSTATTNIAADRGSQVLTQPAAVAAAPVHASAGPLQSLLHTPLPSATLPQAASTLTAAAPVTSAATAATSGGQAAVSRALSQPNNTAPLPSSASTAVAMQQQQQPVGALVAAVPSRPLAPVAGPAALGQAGASAQGRADDRKGPVDEEVWQLASDVMAAGGTATTAAAVTTAAQQAKKRSASDCRARFMMLMRARSAALAAHSNQRMPTPGLAASSSSMTPAAVPAVPVASSHIQTLASLAAQGQAVPTSSLHIATALAAQPGIQPTADSSNPAYSMPAATAVAPSGAPPARQSQAAALPVPALATAAGGVAAIAARQPPSALASLASQTAPRPIASSSAVTSAPAAPVSGRPAGALASLLPGQLYAVQLPAGDTTAVVGGGRSSRVVHKPSLDVLQLRLRLVDMVQGSTALQPKKLNTAFDQATAAAAKESQIASSKAPTSSSAPPMHPTPSSPSATLLSATANSATQRQSQQQPQNSSLPALSSNGPAVPPSQAATAPTAVATAGTTAGTGAVPTASVQTPGGLVGAASNSAAATGYTGTFAAPSVVSGAQRTIKDLEQLSTTSADALEDSIVEAMQAGGVGVGDGAGSGMAGPVLSKSSGPQADQEAKAQAQVEVSLQEAVDILTAATKGCGSYAKPILRHITTVADFAKKEGIQAANEALLKLLQVPKAVPQHGPPQQPHLQQHLTHQQHQQLLQQQRLQQQARQLQAAASQPPSNQALQLQSSLPPWQSSQGVAQVPPGALQLQAPQLQQPQPQLWQVRPAQAGALPGLPAGVSLLQPSLVAQGAHASLAPLAVEISAANLAGLSQPLMTALSAAANHRPGEARPQLPALLPNFVLSGAPVSAPAPPPAAASSSAPPFNNAQS